MPMHLPILLSLLVLAVALVGAAWWQAGQRRAAARRLRQQEIDAQGRQAVEVARRDIEKRGWHLVAILGEDDDSGFVYTIGLWQTYRHPELIVFAHARDPTRIAPHLEALVDRIVKGERFALGLPHAGFFGKYPGTLRAVLPQWFPSYLGIAGGCYEAFDFPAWQVFWPDSEHRFPWQGGYAADLFRFQPILSEANVVLANVGLDTIRHLESMAGDSPLPASLGELFVAADVAEDGLLEEWRWLVGPLAIPFRLTLFGDLFLELPDGRITWLDTGWALHEEVAASEDEWLALICARPEVFFHASTLLTLRALDWKPAAGEVYSWRQPFYLGGEDSVDNIDRVSTVVHLSHSGRLARAVRDLPEGTQIGEILVPDIPPR